MPSAASEVAVRDREARRRARKHRKKSKTTEVIAVHEVLYVLALFCNGAFEDKMDLAFEMFDLHSNGHLTLADMVMLLSCVLTASYKVGITDRVPTDKELENLAGSSFASADSNSDELVVLHEFLDWARRSVASQHAIEAFQSASSHAAEAAAAAAAAERRRRAVRRPSTRGGAGEQNTNDAESEAIARYALAKRRGSRSAEGGPDLPGVPGSPHAELPRGRGRRGSRARRRSATRRSSSAASEGGDGEEASAIDAALDNMRRTGRRTSVSKAAYQAKNFDAKARHYKLHSVANRKLLAVLDAATHFQRSELLVFAKDFADRANTSLYVDEAAFKDLLKSHLPNLASSDVIVERVYAVADKDKDGRVSFREFCFALSTLMRGDVDEKMKFLFELLDVSGDGQVEIREVVSVIRHGNEGLSDLLYFTEEVIRSFDINGDGNVDKEEFASCVAADPTLVDVFQSCIRVTRDTARALHRLKERHKGFAMERLKEVLRVNTSAERHALNVHVEEPEYRGFMLRAFGFPDDDRDVDVLLHHAWEGMLVSWPAKDGVLTLRDVILAAVQVLTGDRQSQVAVFFDVHDLNGDGNMDANEMMFMLLNAKGMVNKAAHDIIAMLDRLDTNSDGVVSYEEFKAQAFRVPLIVNALQSLFHVSKDSEIGVDAANTSTNRARAAVDEKGRVQNAGMRKLAKRRARRSASVTEGGTTDALVLPRVAGTDGEPDLVDVSASTAHFVKRNRASVEEERLMEMEIAREEAMAKAKEERRAIHSAARQFARETTTDGPDYTAEGDGGGGGGRRRERRTAALGGDSTPGGTELIRSAVSSATSSDSEGVLAGTGTGKRRSALMYKPAQRGTKTFVPAPSSAPSSESRSRASSGADKDGTRLPGIAPP